METASDLFKIAVRIFTILPLMLFVTLFMGRRSVGELPVFDYLIIITLGSVVGADIAEPEINHIYIAFAVIVIGILQKLFAELTIRNQKFKGLTTFDPVVVIKDGILIVKNIKKIKYSLENILELLREYGIFNITEVSIALIEANGRLSVYKKPELTPVTPQDLGITKPSGGIAYPVIKEGKVLRQVLKDLHLSEDWLYAQLKNQGFDTAKAVFFATVDGNRQVYISPFHVNSEQN
ncbi:MULTISPECIES: DUF421 domain-containing protein [Pelosinus]|jgi:uncharacterized membrane protein YcaP (DUF421 family)|uniref:YetF C-terminal domain-containing protein n=1 Tax=Pelosinus fermentans B4 TaxID=1149862 RepID=I9L609_9FIRM|nr:MULTISPECIES: DUF421 domain-containing protein [Pelosinus]EIW15676.1 protein of unknown function DUF421 [Pelosinus fermentans B4]EIW26634.1 protein of unknown function DUF421 [Pelosinus fermentans A11]OAM92421.1 protein of unknown function DUF421 [Pelosinus fermentans DSM 17108]SDQ44305.1 Uncharacterized membrane protein YcaP, DUF421 family [Pelosinus fermentans]